jgi:hypothetical protein
LNRLDQDAHISKLAAWWCKPIPLWCNLSKLIPRERKLIPVADRLSDFFDTIGWKRVDRFPVFGSPVSTGSLG